VDYRSRPNAWHTSRGSRLSARAMASRSSSSQNTVMPGENERNVHRVSGLVAHAVQLAHALEQKLGRIDSQDASRSINGSSFPWRPTPEVTYTRTHG
jgi:hypothetical protein